MRNLRHLVMAIVWVATLAGCGSTTVSPTRAPAANLPTNAPAEQVQSSTTSTPAANAKSDVSIADQLVGTWVDTNTLQAGFPAALSFDRDGNVKVGIGKMIAGTAVAGAPYELLDDKTIVLDPNTSDRTELQIVTISSEQLVVTDRNGGKELTLRKLPDAPSLPGTNWEGTATWSKPTWSGEVVTEPIAVFFDSSGKLRMEASKAGFYWGYEKLFDTNSNVTLIVSPHDDPLSITAGFVILDYNEADATIRFRMVTNESIEGNGTLKRQANDPATGQKLIGTWVLDQSDPAYHVEPGSKDTSGLELVFDDSGQMTMTSGSQHYSTPWSLYANAVIVAQKTENTESIPLPPLMVEFKDFDHLVLKPMSGGTQAQLPFVRATK